MTSAELEERRRESKRQPIEPPPPPVNERPKCRTCHKRLRPIIVYDYNREDGRTLWSYRRRWSGGYHKHGTFFCSDRCAIILAIAVANMGWTIVKKEGQQDGKTRKG